MEITKTNADLVTYGKKYNFYHNPENDTVVCTTVYKGQTVRGVAKCDPEDNFDLETGKKLAYLRCKHKFAKYKYARAQQVWNDATVEWIRAERKQFKAAMFGRDATDQLDEATKKLAEFENTLH